MNPRLGCATIGPSIEFTEPGVCHADIGVHQETFRGNDPRAPIGLPRSPYPIYLLLEDVNFQLSEIPGGLIGTTAIYTDCAQATHIIRRVMIRKESWINYIIP